MTGDTTAPAQPAAVAIEQREDHEDAAPDGAQADQGCIDALALGEEEDERQEHLDLAHGVAGEDGVGREPAAVGGDHIKLKGPAPIGFEHDPFSIRRPARVAVMFRAGGQLSRFTARQRHQPDVAIGFVLCLVRPGDDVSDGFAIGRDLRIAEAPDAQEVVELHRPSPACGNGCSQ